VRSGVTQRLRTSRKWKNRIEMDDYLEYLRSSSAYIAELACLVLPFAYQSYVTKETKAKKGQSVQMF
jgi:hypothetical protein